MSRYATAGHGPGGGLGLGMSSPVTFFAAFEARKVASFLCWLMEVWSHVGQRLKCGIWPDLIGPPLALPVLPGLLKILKAKFKRSYWRV